jgi:hypothetical protein
MLPPIADFFNTLKTEGTYPTDADETARPNKEITRIEDDLLSFQLKGFSFHLNDIYGDEQTLIDEVEDLLLGLGLEDLLLLVINSDQYFIEKWSSLGGI